MREDRDEEGDGSTLPHRVLRRAVVETPAGEAPSHGLQATRRGRYGHTAEPRDDVPKPALQQSGLRRIKRNRPRTRKTREPSAPPRCTAGKVRTFTCSVRAPLATTGPDERLAWMVEQMRETTSGRKVPSRPGSDERDEHARQRARARISATLSAITMISGVASASRAARAALQSLSSISALMLSAASRVTGCSPLKSVSKRELVPPGSRRRTASSMRLSNAVTARRSAGSALLGHGGAR